MWPAAAPPSSPCWSVCGRTRSWTRCTCAWTTDEAGEDACDGIMDTLEDMGYDVERLRPEGKDWNDDLRAKRGGHG